MTIQNTIRDNKLIDSKLLNIEIKDLINNNELVIPEGITTIGEKACIDISKYSEQNPLKIIMPQTITTILKEAFVDLTIEKMEFSKNIKKIEKSAFASSRFKENLTLPKLKVIPENCFIRCSFNKKVNFPDNLEKISSRAFSFCEFFEKVTIPENVRIIDSYAFYRSEFKNILLPDCELGYCVFLDDSIQEDNDLKNKIIYYNSKTKQERNKQYIKKFYI